MSMDMRPGFFLFEPSGWLRSAFGSVRPGPVLPCSGWIGCGPVLPGFVLLGSNPVRSSPVQSQFSLAQPGPAQLGPVRPVLVCGSGVVVPVGRALCGLTDGEGPRDLTGRVLCGLTFCRENGLSGRGPVGQLCGRVGALAVAVLAGILSLQVRKRRGTLRVPPFDCIGIFFRSVQKALIDKQLSDPCPVYDRPAASVDEAQRNAEAAVVDVEIGIDLR